jgi:hypothetical protein
MFPQDKSVTRIGNIYRIDWSAPGCVRQRTVTT